MKQIKIIIALTLSTGIFITSCQPDNSKKTDEDKKEMVTDTKSFDINTDKSMVMWEGTMIGIYSHSGTLRFKEGNIDMKDGKIQGGSVIVDMATMKATDENYDPEKGSTKEKLIGHLSSPDFFDVDKYPTAKFVITEHNKNEIKGYLTIRGNTNQETVTNVAISKKDGSLMFTGGLTFDRNKYDVSWEHPMKDKVLSSGIELKIKLVE